MRAPAQKLFSKFSFRLAVMTVFGLSSTVLGSMPGQAQVTARPEAGSANPGRVEQQIQPPVSAPTGANPGVEVHQAPVTVAPAGAANVRFTLHRLTIDGATAYTPEQLAPLYAGRTGRTVSLADIYAIAGDITRKYRNDGYILTQVVVPPQTISTGNVRLKVVEGYINVISVQGVKGHEQEQVLAYARRLSKQVPLNVRDMERSLLLINDLPGVRARSVLSPSKTETGAADLTIFVTRKWADAELDFNNYGTKYLGPYQLGASVALNSVLGLNERITGQTVYAPGAHFDPELQYYALGYMMPVGPYGTTVELDGSYTRTNPGYILKEFDTVGNSEYGSLTVAQPFIRSRQTNLTGRLIVDERDVDTANNLEDDRKDRIRTVRVGGKYEYLDTLLGQGAYNMADMQVTQGLGLFGATDGGLNTSRPGADAGFTKLNAEIQRLQRLAPTFNLLLGATGQVSASKLTTTEQFGVGGQDYGRGYDPSEIIGDHGLAGKAELQWENPIRVPYLTDWQAFGFYDIGATWVRDALTAGDRHDSLASTGLGLRGTLATGTSLNGLLAFPLTRDVQTQGGTHPRLFFGLSQRF